MITVMSELMILAEQDSTFIFEDLSLRKLVCFTQDCSDSYSDSTLLQPFVKMSYQM